MIIKLEKPTSRKSLQKLGYYTCQINYAIIGLTPEDVVYSKNGCTLIGKIEDFDEQGLPVREWLDKATKRIWNEEQQKYFNSYIPYLDCKVCGKLMVVPKEEIYCDNCKEEGHRRDL